MLNFFGLSIISDTLTKTMAYINKFKKNVYYLQGLILSLNLKHKAVNKIYAANILKYHRIWQLLSPKGTKSSIGDDLCSNYSLVYKRGGDEII